MVFIKKGGYGQPKTPANSTPPSQREERPKLKLSDWLNSLSGLLEAEYKVRDSVLRSVRERAKEADVLERMLVLHQQNKDGSRR